MTMDFSADDNEFAVTTVTNDAIVKPEGKGWHLIAIDTQEWGMSFQNIVAVWRRMLPRTKPAATKPPGEGRVLPHGS